jgi:hypothetical protein
MYGVKKKIQLHSFSNGYPGSQAPFVDHSIYFVFIIICCGEENRKKSLGTETIHDFRNFGQRRIKKVNGN